MSDVHILSINVDIYIYIILSVLIKLFFPWMVVLIVLKKKIRVTLFDLLLFIHTCKKLNTGAIVYSLVTFTCKKTEEVPQNMHET